MTCLRHDNSLAQKLGTFSHDATFASPVPTRHPQCRVSPIDARPPGSTRDTVGVHKPAHSCYTFVSSKWLARRPTRHFRGGYELIFLSFSFFYIIVRILAEPRGICQIIHFLFFSRQIFSFRGFSKHGAWVPAFARWEHTTVKR